MPKWKLREKSKSKLNAQSLRRTTKNRCGSEEAPTMEEPGSGASSRCRAADGESQDEQGDASVEVELDLFPGPPFRVQESAPRRPGLSYSLQGSQYRSKFRGIPDISVLLAESDIFFTGQNWFFEYLFH